MNEYHHLGVFSSRTSAARSRLSTIEQSPIRLLKLERGLVQHSLLYCLEKGYFTLIRYLLESGHGNIRERDQEGRTVLMYCCFIKNDCWADNIAMILLENGARIEDQDRYGLNALHYAIITQRLILVKRFLASLDFHLHHSIDIYGNTCLHYACSTGNIDIVRAIINKMRRYSIDFNTKNHCGLTAFDITCQFNHIHCQALLQNEMLFRDPSRTTITTTTMTTTTITPSVSHVTVEPLNERRFSVSTRGRQRTSTLVSQTIGSAISTSGFNSQSFFSRKHSPCTLNVGSDQFVYPPLVFVDPIQTRIKTLKHNANLDRSLVNQVKNRTNFVRTLPLKDQTTPPLSHRSTTWRNDFSKIYQQLQSFKTPSYRQSVSTLTKSDLSTDLVDRLNTTNSNLKLDMAQQVGASASTAPAPKGPAQRRNSVNSLKSLGKPKKVNFNK